VLPDATRVAVEEEDAGARWTIESYSDLEIVMLFEVTGSDGSPADAA
jgi:hypothetical protein